MNTRHLEVIHAVIERGGVMNAADALNVSQPAISRMIRSAEIELGLKLFERIGRKLVPTEDARLLFEEISPVLASLNVVRDRIVDLREGRAGILRIVATPGLAHSIVPQALEELFRRRPNAKVSLDIRRRENVLQMVRANASELGLGLTETDVPDLLSIPLGGGRIVCVVPAGHELAARRSVRPADLRGHRLIIMARGSPLGTLIEDAFERENEPLDWAIETPYSATACSFARAGLGAALVDEYVAYHSDMEGTVMLPFEPGLAVNAFIYRSRTKAPSKLASLFISALTTGRMSPGRMESAPDQAR
ncbi:MAG: LysR family transcriptional regulator [Tropicimonas sp.]|uniref:LysR family transcriptional regulator n=1 Tax=Tropicimonas sp. TaxID=2067044 RepID=UPI003A8631A7